MNQTEEKNNKPCSDCGETHNVYQKIHLNSKEEHLKAITESTEHARKIFQLPQEAFIIISKGLALKSPQRTTAQLSGEKVEISALILEAMLKEPEFAKMVITATTAFKFLVM